MSSRRRCMSEVTDCAKCDTNDESDVKHTKSGDQNNSQIPRYIGGGRQRRHSDSQSKSGVTHNHQTNAHSSNGCLIHGIRSSNDNLLYQMLQTLDLSNNQIPDQIRTIHENHVCSNIGKSRSVPTSKLTSRQTTPFSTPSTPTDSRRLSANRSTLSHTSSPLRQSKSSLTMPSSYSNRTTSQKTFAEYMPLCELQKGLQKGEIVEGVLRINPRNYTDAYISAPEGGLDIYVGGMIDRNRSLNGDKVAVKLNECKDWKILYDTLRVNYHEWGQDLEGIYLKYNTHTKEAVNLIANCSNSTLSHIEIIDENDEDLEEKSLSVSLSPDSIDTKLSNDNDVNESVVKIDETSDTKSKPKKKRSRNKKKNKSDVKPNANESVVNKTGKVVKVFDELSKRIDRIRGISVEHLMEALFWKKFIQKTGKVVSIVESNHIRIAGGKLTHMKDKNQNWALFVPNDSRFPRLRIPMNLCPHDFYYHPQHYSDTLFVAKIEEWKTTDHFPSGSLIRQLGNAGDIDVESDLILIENNIESEEFPDEAYYGLPNITDNEWEDLNSQWTIPDKEIHYRRDFRNECVFTIDPSTARDLDDALSIKLIDDDLFEVGVHIADVSHFLKEDMPLDEIARRRTTSIYLVQKVIPMLPQILCEKLCSLNAGEDKLSFSVVWMIDKNGDIVSEWFGRTIIRSCVKLSYELAQDMINDSNHKETGLPIGFSPYIYRDSNKLVEELMLLANMAVAHKIYNTFCETGFLRNHPPPSEDALRDFNKFCDYNGFHVDTSSSLLLNQTLETIVNNDPNISRVVAHYLLKTMQMARYVCPGMESASLHHYALNVPLYTHFTSPIRRYADVIVHRLLAASLSYCPQIKDSPTDLHRLAQRCNDKKLASRIVSEKSAHLFLNCYIKHIHKMETKAIVVQVYDHSFDVMVINCGIISRVYVDPLPLKQFTFSTKHGKNELVLEWIDSTDSLPKELCKQTITACLIVRIQVSVNEEDSSKLNTLLQHPNGNFIQNQFIKTTNTQSISKS
ncbi:DIS3-like exonuclease 2 [Oppia nitens]|uniref:DIS3-like exonuclease 2 n=1 Tax=Oppia nitens TaxID=1686743 RepID=UPI0023DB44A4|nr:DIS3-like exonuclease 2 [Oppia nitens]